MVDQIPKELLLGYILTLLLSQSSHLNTHFTIPSPALYAVTSLEAILCEHPSITPPKQQAVAPFGYIVETFSNDCSTLDKDISIVQLPGPSCRDCRRNMRLTCQV